MVTYLDRWSGHLGYLKEIGKKSLHEREVVFFTDARKFFSACSPLAPALTMGVRVHCPIVNARQCGCGSESRKIGGGCEIV